MSLPIKETQKGLISLIQDVDGWEYIRVTVQKNEFVQTYIYVYDDNSLFGAFRSLFGGGHDSF